MRLTVSEDMALNFLVVDDSAPSRFITTRCLADFEVDFSEAQDGLDALEKINEEDYDLILLDLSMPKMNGTELLATLNEQGKKVNAVVMSAKIDQETIDEVMGLGAVDYIIKPCSGKNLVERINENLNKLDLPLLES